MPPKLVRYATVVVNHCAVHWQNAVGPHLGQCGRYTFASIEDTERFAAYARSDPAPSLANADLEAAGIPQPIEREDKP